MKHSQLKQLIKEEIRSALNEGLFSKSRAQEVIKLNSALSRWIEYSLDSGDNKEEALDTVKGLADEIMNKQSSL